MPQDLNLSLNKAKPTQACFKTSQQPYLVSVLRRFGDGAFTSASFFGFSTLRDFFCFGLFLLFNLARSSITCSSKDFVSFPVFLEVTRVSMAWDVVGVAAGADLSFFKEAAAVGLGDTALLVWCSVKGTNTPISINVLKVLMNISRAARPQAEPNKLSSSADSAGSGSYCIALVKFL